MKGRCGNKRQPDYKDYGGRGIRVCGEWADDFGSFRDWAQANGYTDGLTLDRIDNDGNYEPGNCRWATVKQQGRNKRTTVFATAFGETKSVPEWAEDGRCVVSDKLLRKRIRNGINGELAVSLSPKEMADRRKPMKLLTESQHEEIRRRVSAGESRNALAKVFGVSSRTLRRAVNELC